MQTFTGKEYLEIDIANNFGLDKLDWDERIAWTQANIHDFENLLPVAENPALFYAGVQAYYKTQEGLPTGYPVSLDAAASGLQLLSCLTGCEASASLCGVVSTGHRADAYTTIYKHMLDTIQDTAKISRDDCKRAIMTSLYSSQAVPKQVFGKGELLQVFYQTMETRAPGAWALNQVLQQLWQPYALSHDWVLPDNFHAHIKVEDDVTHYVKFQNTPVAIHVKENRGTKEGRSISPNIIHSIDGMIVREMHRRCTFDVDKIVILIDAINGRAGDRTDREQDKMVLTLWNHYQNSGFLSARILDYLDEQNLLLVDRERVKELILSMPVKSFPVISIHDCFRVHPNHTNTLRSQYNRILSEIAGSSILAYLASQVCGYQVTVTKRGDISSKILEADYALT